MEEMYNKKLVSLINGNTYSKQINKNENEKYLYFKNDRLLKNEAIELSNSESEVIEYEESQFKNDIRKEINYFIDKSQNIIVLIGAGASVVTDSNGDIDLDYGPTMRDLANLIDTELKISNDFYTIDELKKFCNYKEDEVNIENLLSKLQTYMEFIYIDGKESNINKNFDKKKYKKSIEEILKIIKKHTDIEYNENVFKHANLIKKLSDIVTTPYRVSFVTTNYDSVIEKAAASIGYIVFDGFTFNIDPQFDAEMFDWILARNIPNVISKQFEYKKSIINLLKIHGSLNWERGNNGEILRKNNITQNPIMIFPSSDKYMHSYERPYFELFTKFQDLLRKQNTLLITTGFSFADYHISSMIEQAIKSNPSLSLLISEFNLESDEHKKNCKNLYRLMDKGFNISFLNSTMNSDLPDYFGGNIYENW